MQRLIPIIAVILLAACSRDGGSDRRVTFRTGIDVGNDAIVLHASGHPSAKITKQGDLLIDGRPVALTEAQKQLARDYRARIGDVARQGADIGKAGAQLGIDAAGEALKGVFSGDTDAIGRKVEARAERIKQEALKICDELDGLRGAQDALAGAVPAFQPYARMDVDDIADCRS